jgi:hypothetical protein
VQKACGVGKVIAITGMQSAAASRAQDRTTTNADSLRELRGSYGLTEAQARKVFAQCARNFGGGTCPLTPPPPVLPGQACPSGTKLSFGLCRTPEGYIRPLPKWIEDVLKG